MRVVDTVNKIITISFTLTSLMDEVKASSYYTARHLKNQEGESLIEDLGVDAEDEDMLSLYFKTAAQEILKKLSFLQYLLPDGTIPFVFDTGVADKVEYVIMLKDTMAANIDAPIESDIHDALIAYGLSEWYKANGKIDSFQLHKAVYDEEMKELSHTLRLRQRAAKKSAGFFQ